MCAVQYIDGFMSSGGEMRHAQACASKCDANMRWYNFADERDGYKEPQQHTGADAWDENCVLFQPSDLAL